MFLTLIPLIALALNLVVVLGVFFGLHRPLWKLRSRVSACEGKIESSAVQLAETIQDVHRKITQIAEIDASQPSSLAATPGSGLSTTLRSKALKMHRMGQPMDRIAENLRVPKGEVELLVKVHQIVMRPYEDGRNLVRQDATG